MPIEEEEEEEEEEDRQYRTTELNVKHSAKYKSILYNGPNLKSNSYVLLDILLYL